MAKRFNKPGKNLERLISALEKAVAGSDKVTVEAPKFVRDRVTGENREHDVLVTIRGGHHATTVAIECRDRSRKVTVNDVEAFAAKCRDTGVDQGVMVSPRGFSKTALAKAQFHGIRTLTLLAAESFGWLLAPGVVLLNKRVLHTSWTFYLENEPEVKPNSYTVLAPDGTETTTSALVAAAFNEFQKIPPQEFEVGRGKKAIMFNSPGLNIRDNASGVVYRIERALAIVDFEVTEQLIPFQLVTYAPADGGEAIAHAAVADLEFGQLKGKFVFHYKPDEGGEIVFVRERDDD